MNRESNFFETTSRWESILVFFSFALIKLLWFIENYFRSIFFSLSVFFFWWNKFSNCRHFPQFLSLFSPLKGTEREKYNFHASEWEREREQEKAGKRTKMPIGVVMLATFKSFIEMPIIWDFLHKSVAYLATLSSMNLLFLCWRCWEILRNPNMVKWMRLKSRRPTW